MAKLGLDKGRILQKLKTRELLVLKANAHLKKGTLASIEQVAKDVGISKATAYRYFANLDSLKTEASLQLKAEMPDNLFAGLENASLSTRMERLIDYHYHLFISNEQEFRLFLSSVIGQSVSHPNVSTRGGRRIAMIAEALEPVKSIVTPKEFDHMLNSLSIVLGIESITVLKDLCGLNNKAVLENWKWMIFKLTNITL
jgi:AcrR family transcriptional regulator